jgi:hypothetical protein
MTETTITQTYTFVDQDACKFAWTFVLKPNPQGWLIADLQVAERDKPRGCSGHLQTITALLKSRLLNTINHPALAGAACGRSLSCGQALAYYLASLTEEIA